MFGGGKNKVVCPECRAKNPAGQRRCRVCTAIIDESVDAGDVGFMGPGGRAAPAADPVPPPSAPAAAPAHDAPPADPLDAIVIEAPQRNPDAAPPPIVHDDDEWDPNWMDNLKD